MMSEYGDVINETFGLSKQDARLTSTSSIDDDPEKAARAAKLGQATGVDPLVVYGDVEGFERNHKATLTSQLIEGNQYLTDYINSHPLAAKISNDDFGQLDSVSQAMSKIGPDAPGRMASHSVLGKAISGFKEGFGDPQLGEWMLKRPHDVEFAKEHPWIFNVLATVGGVFELPGKVISGGLHGLQSAVEEGGTQLGMERSSAKRLGRDLAGMAEYKLLQTPTPHMIEAVRRSEPYIRAGEEPPVGVHPLIDQAKAEQAKVDAKNLDEALKESSASATRERSPEIFAGFIRQHTDAKIGISVDAVRELYGTKEPHPQDGILGWVPDIVSQLRQAEAVGGDITIPLADWLAKVEPQVASKLHDDVRMRKGGLTVNEGKEVSTDFMVEAYHGSPHDFEAFQMEKIGTGEGAQSYGHGLYFAEKAEVGEQYRGAGRDREARDRMREIETIWEGMSKDDPQLIRLQREYHSLEKYLDEDTGNLYRVRIHADKEHFLDWDKPFAEQPSAVQATFNKFDSMAAGTANPDFHFHQWLRSKSGAKALREAGIPGIKYLDQGSRDLGKVTHEGDLWKVTYREAGEQVERDFKTEREARSFAEMKGQQTHNFVLFDESLIEITHKNDQAVEAIRSQAGLKPMFEIGPEKAKPEAPLREGQWEQISSKVRAFIPEEFTAAEHALFKAVDEVVARIAPKLAEAYPAIGIEAATAKGQKPVRGVYTQYKDRLPLILYSLTAEDPIGIARHEVIHHLRAYDFFTKEEWKLLEDTAEKEGWISKQREGTGTSAAERYKHLDKEKMLEEAIADEFQWWSRHPDEPTLAGKVFEKLREFLNAIKEVVNRLRSQDPGIAEIFAKIESGEVGSRTTKGPRHPDVFKPEQFAEQPELPGVTRQEDLKIFDKSGTVGITEAHYKLYMQLIEKRNAEDAKAQMDKATKLERQRQSKEWKEDAAKMRDEVKDDIENRPDIAAAVLFRDGVLYGDKLTKKVRLDEARLTEEQKASLPPEFYGKNGIAPDDAAGLFGYQTGAALVDRLALFEQARGEVPIRQYITQVIDSEVDRRMRKKYGNLEENILAEAKDHVISDTQMDLLHEETVALGMKAGSEMPFTKEDLKTWVQGEFDKSQIGALKVDTFLNSAGKAGRAAELALLENSPTKAFRQKQRQYLAVLFADQAKKLEKDMGKFEKVAKQFSKREVPSVPQEYTNFIHDILTRVGQPVRRSIQDLQEAIQNREHKTLEDFVASKEADLREIPVAEFLFDPAFRKPLEELTAEEFRAVKDSITALVKNGRDELKIERAGEAADLAEIKTQMIEQLREFKEKKYAASQTGATKLTHAIRTYGAAHLQMESLLNRWDRGDPKGVFTQYVMRDLADAATHEAGLERKYSRQLKAIADKADLKELIDNPIFADPLSKTADNPAGDMLQLNRKNLRAILLNAGNESNLIKLARGYGIEPEAIVNWLHKHATKEDWQWAQKIGDIFAEIKKEADIMYRGLSGIEPESIPIKPVNTPHGTFAGWYYPLIYHPIWEGKSKKLMGGDALEQNNYIRATTPQGYTKQRTSYAAPLDLDLDALPGRMKSMLHDIAFRPSVINASKIMYDHDIRAAITKHYGREYTELLIPYIKDVANAANYRSEAQKVGTMAMEYFRQNVIAVLIGFNPGTVVKHGFTAAVNSLTEVGPTSFLKAAKSLFSMNEETGNRNWTFAMETSGELARRHRHYIETIRGAQEDVLRNRTMRESLIAAGSYPVAFFDLLSAVPTWLAQYEKTMKAGETHGDAVFAADRAVRRAHGSSVITNRSGVMRGGAMAQWMASLYGFFNHIQNRQFELAWKTAEARGLVKKGDYAEAASKVPELTRGLFSYILLPALIEELVTPYSNEERHSWGYMAATGVAHTLASSLIGIRDIAHAALSKHDPAAGLLSTGAKTITDLVRDLRKDKPLSKEHSAKLIRHGITAFGALSGLTNAQEGKAAEFIFNYTAGKERPKKFGDWARGFRHGSMYKSSPIEDIFYGQGKRK